MSKETDTIRVINADRWNEIMDAMAQNSGLLASRFMAQIGTLTGYTSGEVTEDELQSTAQKSFEGIAMSLRNGEAVPELLSLAADVGSSRARRGVPGESLSRAARLDFAIVWDHLLEICGPPDASLLATHVELVWEVIDQYISALNASYTHETIRMARSERAYRREFVSRLFGRTGQSPEVIAAAASALRFDADEEFTIVAATEHYADHLTAELADVPRNRGVLLFERDGMTYGFWQSTKRGHAGNRIKISDPVVVTTVSGMVQEVDGLKGLAAAAETAGSLARVATEADKGPVMMDRGWIRLAREKVRESGLDLAADAHRRLALLNENERARIEETVREYLYCGNVNLTAQRLFCHRNTILNRLNRFKALTGIDLVIPADAARLVIGWL